MKLEEYEFQQNNLILDLSKNMRFVGIFLIVVSVLNLLGGFLIEWRLDGTIGNSISYIFWGILNLLIGIWTVQAATDFKRIVDERGDDMKNLMAGLGKVSKIYEVQRWFFIFIVVTLLVLLILFVLAIFVSLNP